MIIELTTEQLAYIKTRLPFDYYLMRVKINLIRRKLNKNKKLMVSYQSKRRKEINV